MKKITRIISEIFTGAAALATLFAGRAMAITSNETNNLTSIEKGIELVSQEGMPRDLTTVVREVSNTALVVIGAVAVIMLIYGGFRYVISGGDAKKVADAKNTILYAIIGLIIALLASAIVNFVMKTIGA